MDFESDDEGEQMHSEESQEDGKLNALSTTEKKEIIEVLDSLKEMEKLINKYLRRKDHVELKDEDFTCKVCGKTYSTGRQLGGHVSRKHPGCSQTYNRKKNIQKAKTGERARR